jgi:hypothetical protein
MALGGACLFALSVWRLCSGEMNSTPLAISVFAPGVAALWLFLNAGFFVYTTRVCDVAAWLKVARSVSSPCLNRPVAGRHSVALLLQNQARRFRHCATRRWPPSTAASGRLQEYRPVAPEPIPISPNAQFTLRRDESANPSGWRPQPSCESGSRRRGWGWRGGRPRRRRQLPRLKAWGRQLVPGHAADDCLGDLLQRAEASDEVSRRCAQPCRFTMKSTHTGT